MKLSSCSLPHLYQVKTDNVNLASGKKETFSRKPITATFKIDKLPVIQSSVLHDNIGMTGKCHPTEKIEGNNFAAKLRVSKLQAPSVAPMTTTFRESYRGEFGPPASSTRRRETLPGPFRVGSSSYSLDFGAMPLRKRTPPRVRQGNILNSYPGNVLYPYTLPEQVITVWKPFPVQKSDSNKTDEILARIVRKMYRTSYQLDFTKSGAPVIPDCSL